MSQAVKFRFDLEALEKFQRKINPSTGERFQRRCSAEDFAAMIGLTSAQQATLRKVGHAYIICTFRQFVMFQIARRDAGYINRFLDLQVEIIDTPEMPEVTFDVRI